MRVLWPILASAALALSIPSNAMSAPKPAKQTVRGKLIVGSLAGVIELSGRRMYSFASDSRIARKLLAGCNNTDEFCEAEVIANSDQEILRVLKVRKLRRDQLTPAERQGLKTYLTGT
jgi:hypothetical protein